MNAITKQDALHALSWYLDNGVDDVLSDAPVDRTAMPPPQNGAKPVHTPAPRPVQSDMLGKTGARAEAIRLAGEAKTLDDLRKALESFDGLAVKKTATNMVFADGNPQGAVMIVGEAPGADEDRQGKPFVGVSGQLLDRILACIDLCRTQDSAENAVYISNILNWRPPGNRTPSPSEVDISLPFIEKHIMLVRPKVLVFCGGVAAKGLLGREDSVGKLRKTWHDYKPLTAALGYEAPPIPALVTYHPAYLLRTPAQKKAVWQDMLMLQERLRSL